MQALIYHLCKFEVIAPFQTDFTSHWMTKSGEQTIQRSLKSKEITG